MSKMGSYVMDMQEDAVRLSLKQFIDRYGYGVAEMWHDINYGDSSDVEPDCQAQEEGYRG